MADRDKHVFMAKLAEQAEKYDGEFLQLYCKPEGRGEGELLEGKV